MGAYNMLKKSAAVLLVVCSPLSGCVSPPHPPEEPAVTVAKSEALEKWGWEKVEVNSTSFENGRWIIRLTMLPKTPGGHATVEVSEDGKVVDTRSGR